MMGLGRTPPSTSRLPPAPREVAHTNDVWLSLSVAAVLSLCALTIGLWPTEPRTAIAPQSAGAAVKSTKDPLPGAPEQTEPVGVQNLPTRFANPFDASEVFEFPPGTTKDVAREWVAETLLQRARERRALIGTVKHVHGHPPGPFRTPGLMTENLFKRAS